MPAVQNKMKGNKDKQTVKSSNKATPWLPLKINDRVLLKIR